MEKIAKHEEYHAAALKDPGLNRRLKEKIVRKHGGEGLKWLSDAYAEIYFTDKNGAPVTAVLELQPTNKGGELLNMNVIASAYGKDSNPAGFIRNSDLLYLDPNKNRTESWMQGLGLQLPSDATAFGSIGTISYPDGKVKIDGVPYEEYMQNGREEYAEETDSEGRRLTKAQAEFFKDSKVRDENGRLRVVYHGTNSGNFTVFDKQKLGSANDPGWYGLGAAFADLFASVGRLFGIPVYNIKRDVMGIANTTLRAIGNWQAMYEADKLLYSIDSSDNRSHYYDIAFYAWQEEDHTQYDAIVADMLKHGYTQKDIENAVQMRLRKRKDFSASAEAVRSGIAVKLTQSKAFTALPAAYQAKALETASDYCRTLVFVP
ncbi:MAG: hypothetical protein GX488_04930 [Clostridiales bacterium]|nr:hypothetical protein [Clostridiales bacterium]